MRMNRLTAASATAALVLVLLAIGIRFAVSGPDDVDKLAQFQSSSGIDVGPEAAWFATGLNGDGAVYTLIAADPLGADVGQRVFFPSYRYSRAGFSWLAAALVLGMDHLLLLGLSLVGMASLATVGWQAVRLRETHGLRAWILLANPALYVGFVGDTAEPLSIALLTLALAHGSILSSGGLAIVRPDYLVALLSNWRLAISSAALAVVFRLIWVVHFGDSVTGGLFNLSWPFVGILETSSPVGWLVIVAGLFTLINGFLDRDISWVASGLLVICFSAVVLDTPVNAVRAAGLLPVLWAFGPRKMVGLHIPRLLAIRWSLLP
ncbi:MAG TPA: hypothetical protein VJA46_00175 [Acidimicrobiia bacterium]|nr:hypothetical protein [Acidimicrobiia bacterium]